MNGHKIKVLVVEESGGLLPLLAADPAIQVVGSARSGRSALQFLAAKSADVVLMDIQAHAVDCFDVTRRIMETQPLPIVICNNGDDPRGVAMTFRSMQAGAVACVETPPARGDTEFPARAAHLLKTVKLMSEVKVVHRWNRQRRESPPPPPVSPSFAFPVVASDRIERIGIGASTGGPPVLQTILAALPKDFSIPILIVQHIAQGFLPGLADWLNQTTGVKIHIAAHGMEPLPGHVYLAPDNMHMTTDSFGRIALSQDPPDAGLRPSVAHLFDSLADVYGPAAVGVLLTGMGKDGAQELKRMRDAGAATIVQDQETSVIFGMPGEAVALSAARWILPANRIAPTLVALTHQPLSPQLSGVES